MMKNLIRKLLNVIIVVAIPGSTYLVFLLLKPERFGSLGSMFLLLQQSIVPTIASMGLLFILYMGLFDFSIGAILVMSSLIGLTFTHIYGYPGYILGCIITAVLLELVNATLYTILKIPSLIVTVGTMMIFEAVGTFIVPTDVQLPYEYSAFGRYPANLILGFISLVMTYIILDRTRYGLYVKAIGRYEIAAERMGVSRPTFGRILAQARRTLATAITEGKALRIQGGVVISAPPFRGRGRRRCRRGWGRW